MTATLNKASTADTTVTLSVTPNAGATAGDVTLSANRVLTIAAGTTTGTGTVTITANDNNVQAAAKTFTVSATVANADEDIAAPDDVRLTVDDDDGGICGRTRQVREAILARIDGVTRCADVTDAHLSSITGTLDLSSKSITIMRAGDFAGLTAVRRLDLYSNALATLPSGLLTGLSSLRILNLYDNTLTSLPPGLLAGLSNLDTLFLDGNSLNALPSDLLAPVSHLQELWARNNALTKFPPGFFAGKREMGGIQVYHNPGDPDLKELDPVASHRGDPLGVYYFLEPLGQGRFKIVVPVGTAFETAVSLNVINGTLDNDRIVMPAGRLESGVLTVTRTPGTSAPVTVDIVDLRSTDLDRRPGDLSRKLTSERHNGIVPAKSGDLPLEVLAATPPALASAVVNGDVLTLTYEEALDESSTPAASAYSVSVGGVAQTPSAVTVSGSAVTVTLSAQAYVGQEVTVSYTAPASNPVQTAAGSDVETLTAYALTNETPNAAPTIDTAEALDVAENERTVVTLAATDPDPHATQTWSLTGGADQRHFTLSENVLTFTAEKDFEQPDDTDSDGSYEVTVTVVDDRGAAASQAVTVTLTDVVTEAPTASDGEVETDEDTPYSFAAGDFNFAGTDADDALASVKIVTGPSAGSLEFDGAAVTADQVVTTAQLDNGDLVFTPAANAHGSGYATFTFKVSDGEAESADAYTMTVDVTAVNDAATGAPTISGTTMVGQTLTASTLGIADPDGLTGVSYSYQWIRVDSGLKDNPRTIAGATSRRYTLTGDDQYENVMVKVSFTDDDRNDEALTSDASTRVRASLSSIPASADVLVSNLGQIQDGVRGRFSRIDMAQRFTTGSNAGGYALRSVDLYIMTNHHSGPIPPTVKIFSGSADGAEVAVLRGPAALELNIEKTYAFTASGTVTLDPSTDYWVVAEGGTANWQGTSSDNEDAASASGWSIRDVSEYRDASSTDSFLDAAYNATRLRINGAANGLVFSRTQVAVDEGGTAGYTVQLDARPSASVTVSLASGDEEAASVDPGSLTFTASDWNIAQTVTVTGVRDDDGDHESVTLTHSAAGFDPRTVTVAVNDDDDSAGPAAGSAKVTGASLVIAFDDDLAAAPDLANGAFTVKKTPSGGTERTETLTGSPSIDGRTVTLTLGSAAVSTDTGVTVSYTRPATGSGNRLADGNGNEVADFTLAATNDTPDCPAGQPADAFATACLTVAEVNFGYGYSLTGGAISSASGAKTWNFTRNGKSYEISEIKTVRSGNTNAGLNIVFGANPPPASESWILQVGSRSFRFDARTRYTLFSNVPGHRYVWASPGFLWTADNVGDRVSVSLRSDARGLTFSPSAVEVDEGGTATYSVKLDARPSVSVTVDVVSGDEDAATVSDASLTFTTSDWSTAQEVTVTGIEDDDGNHETVTLTHSGAGVGTATVAVRVNDDDAAAQAPTAPGYTAPDSLQVGAALTPMNPSDGAGIDSYSAGGLPSGLSIDTSTGVISGTPDTANADTASVTVTVSDSAGNTDTVAITFPAVAKGDQALSGFAYSSASVTFGSTAPTVTAPSGVQTTLSYSAGPATVCTVDASTGALTILGAGSCEITATAAGNDNYNAATATYTVTVQAAGTLALNISTISGDDTINTAEKAAGFTIGGDTGSEGGVSVTVSVGSTELTAISTDADPATWSVGVPANASYITGTSVGVKVTASKTGFISPDAVIRTLAVDLIAPTAPAYTAPASLQVGTALTPMNPSDGAGIDSYSASGLPSGLSIDTGTGAISGTPDTANADTASVTVTVSDTSGNTDTVDIAFPAVAKGDQDLSGFAYSSASVTFGSTAPTVTAPSGVQTTLSYSAGPATVCTVDASTGALTIVGAGSCEITAMAAGNDNYNAATATYTVTSEPVLGAPTNLRAAGGDEQVSLTWSAPQYDGRITGYEFRFCRVVSPSDCSGERATASAEAGGWTSTDSANAHTVMYWYHDSDGQAIRFRLVNGNRYRFQVRAVAGELVGEATAWLEGIPSAPPPPPAVLTEFVLVDVSDQSAVATLSDGAAVDLGARVGGSFGVRARVASGADIGSVALSLSGAKTVSRTENIAPYSLYGDANTGTGSALYGEDLPAGSYTLSATAYSGRRASGAVLDTLTVSFRVLSAPALSVADASIEEGADATLDFAVTLDKAANVTVTVDYATSDGTATAGQDYTATSGTLTFAAGTREQTVSVPVLEDDHDDGGETLTLRLTNAAGATIGAGIATGTIENSDPLPKAWLSRFGRTSALHVVGILDARFEAAARADNHFTLGGRAVNLATLRQTVTGRPTEPDGPEHAEPPATGNADAADPANPALANAAHADACADCDGNQTAGAEQKDTAQANETFAKLWQERTAQHETGGQSNITPERANGNPLQDVTLTPSVPATDYGQTASYGDAAHHRQTADYGQAAYHGQEADPALTQQAENATLLETALWQALTNPVSLQVDRRFISQSSFHLSLTDMLRPDEQETDNIETIEAAPERAGHWSLWGQGALTRFQGTENSVNLDGEVLTGLLGLDYAKKRWLTGVALAYHDGDGSYRASGSDSGGDLNSALVTVNPYLRYTINDRLSAWGTIGYGTGTLQLRPQCASGNQENRGQGDVTPDYATGPDDDNGALTPFIPGMGEPIETDLRMSMGVVGLRGVVYAGANTELALKSDALWVRTASGETQGLQAVDEADTSRIRLLLSGRHQRALPNDALLLPSFELGIRYDGGDAETGFGMELGGGLRYADSVLGLTVETRARALIAHEDSGYREWGLGGSVALDPGHLGRGLALRLHSGWGIADRGAEALWQRQSAAGLAPQQGPTARGHLSVELGYGLYVPWTYGILTPYSGMELGSGSRTLRLGWRFNLGQQLSLSLDGERRETTYTAPEHGLILRTTLPW